VESRVESANGAEHFRAIASAIFHATGKRIRELPITPKAAVILLKGSKEVRLIWQEPDMRLGTVEPIGG
jgi:hypothetical protein